MGKREREQKNCLRERGRQTERQRQQIQIYNVIVHQMTYINSLNHYIFVEKCTSRCIWYKRHIMKKNLPLDT